MEENKRYNQQGDPGNNIHPPASLKPRDKSNNPSNTGKNKTTKRKKKSFFEVWKSYSRVKQVVYSAGIVAAIAAVTAVVVNIVQARQSQTNATNEQRPYLTLSRGAQIEARAANNPTMGLFLVSVLPITNTGKSPALHVLEAAAILSGDDPLHRQVGEWFQRIGIPLNKSYDQDKRMYLLRNGIEVSEETIMQGDSIGVAAYDMQAAIAKRPIPTDAVAVVARIEYADTIGNPYWTDICYYLSRAITPDGGSRQMPVLCPGFNHVR